MTTTMLRKTMLAATMIALGGVSGLLTACNGPEYPNCDNDEQCHEGEFCVNGQCQQCRPDGNDCGAGQRCVDGRCDAIPGWCGSSGDCPSGQECVDNRCVASTTSGNDTGNTGNGGCSLQTVYFAYDSSDIGGGTGNALESNARCINERDVPHVTITGHCDPRGTEEYNLALGDRRARGVQSYMERLGVDRSRMTTRSMGEEMARGSDESSWSQDRRVEFEER
ncbi:MAG: OmpA family protein [Sandaracinaceae bacterium]